MLEKERQGPNVYGTDSVVTYRLLAPGVYTPPRSHKREAEDRFVCVYTPELERLDELGIIDVTEWGGNP